MLAFTNSEERQGQCFHLLGTAKQQNTTVHLISDNTSLISSNISILSAACEDSCSFYSGPSDAAILSFAEQAESCGSIAYSGSESCGSIAYSAGGFGGGSVSTSSCSSGGGGFSGGGCSYSC